MPPAQALCEWPKPRNDDLTSSSKTKMPITIDGKPLRTSSQSFTWFATSGRANSLT